MSDQDPVLGLLDDVLAIVDGTDATSVEISADGFSLSVRRRPVAPTPAERAEQVGKPAPGAAETIRVCSPGVGIFSATREWRVGDHVEQGESLGGVQSLGQVAEITAPATGSIREILTAGGAPVEYGQPLLSLERA